jgi:hypothetical protein
MIATFRTPLACMRTIARADSIASANVDARRQRRRVVELVERCGGSGARGRAISAQVVAHERSTTTRAPPRA